jgi:drug/metabolite transporter (DMT)-like permease
MEGKTKGFNEKVLYLGIGGIITGVLTSIIGLCMMLLRIKLAVIFLGARVFVDMPFAQQDSVKIGLIMLLAIAVFLTGVMFVCFGGAITIYQYARKKASEKELNLEFEGV